MRALQISGTSKFDSRKSVTFESNRNPIFESDATVEPGATPEWMLRRALPLKRRVTVG